MFDWDNVLNIDTNWTILTNLRYYPDIFKILTNKICGEKQIIQR